MDDKVLEKARRAFGDAYWKKRSREYSESTSLEAGWDAAAPLIWDAAYKAGREDAGKAIDADADDDDYAGDWYQARQGRRYARLARGVQP